MEPTESDVEAIREAQEVVSRMIDMADGKDVLSERNLVILYEQLDVLGDALEAVIEHE
jgi:hypothetical protein